MHQYPLHSVQKTTAEGMRIRWQQGPIANGKFNGATVEVVVRAAIHRLQDYQAGPLRCEHNEQAIRFLNEVLGLLDARTRDRFRRGVLGTGQP